MSPTKSSWGIRFLLSGNAHGAALSIDDVANFFSPRASQMTNLETIMFIAAGALAIWALAEIVLS